MENNTETSFVINNYQKGAKLGISPTQKIVSMEKIDKNHHKIVYSGLTENEMEFCKKLFCKRWG